jgi:polyphosphate kinase 2 (PPK2 family)
MAGKGGAIKRLTRAMAARDYHVVPIGAPTTDELARCYLWRFWRELPRAGRTVIFDRSWYGRVLVERVEELIPPPVWRRAYGEIVEFEEQLVESGVVLAKFWLQIDADEQLRRFQAREETASKQHKLGPDDWRNRSNWDAYTAAADELLALTDTPRAPWTLVAASDKRWARVRVIEAVVAALEARLG